MKDKGLMGIGTLIIFIAIILVAAVAAAVLISTSGSLQQRALTTGGETESGIATGVDIFSITSTNGSDGNVDYFSIFMRLNPGSDPVKLNNSILT
ncbi:archaellin/type IV pilin N-terminal domain-containing protein, partial [Candidatus Altiarchaeota archaeon]